MQSNTPDPFAPLDSGIQAGGANPQALDALGIPEHLRQFEASHEAALHRLKAVRPGTYARTRNALDGGVTGLSPYFTHGLLGMQQAVQTIHSRHPLGFDDKLAFEFAWREFFHHVWSRAPGGADAILKDLHGSPPYRGTYNRVLPDDIRQGRTGVPAIDSAVRTLYATGYLHNHARMWLASYVVHVRKVHWRAGADWLYSHLLDGDLPSNHLSWQWVAATFSSKPYLFNAENVLRYAPAGAQAAWACSGTVVDTSYEALDLMARDKRDAGPEHAPHGAPWPAITEPAVAGSPPADILTFLASFMPVVTADIDDYAMNNIAYTSLELVHPWAVSPRPATQGSGQGRIGVIHLPAHRQWPWSARRWQFVLRAMASVCDAVWIGDLRQFKPEQFGLKHGAGGRVTAQATLFPGYREALASAADVTPAPRWLPNPTMLCRSFTKFYTRAQQDAGPFEGLLS